MTHKYSVYERSSAPQGLLSHYPEAAEYDINGKAIYLFADTLEEITGLAAANVVDVSVMTLTDSELDAVVNDLAAGACTGKEIQLSHNQVDYIFYDRFYIEE